MWLVVLELVGKGLGGSKGFGSVGLGSSLRGWSLVGFGIAGDIRLCTVLLDLW